MIVRDKFFIDGRWVAPALGDKVGQPLEVHDSGSGEVMGRVPAGTPADARAAAAAARQALESWSARPIAERADFLKRIAERIKERSDELALLMAREVGMPVKLSGRIQVGLPQGTFANTATLAKDYVLESRIGNSLVLRDPVGVVAAITPWNYPLHQIALKVAPALAAGCTVIVKPSEVAPLNAFVLAEIMDSVRWLERRSSTTPTST